MNEMHNIQRARTGMNKIQINNKCVQRDNNLPVCRPPSPSKAIKHQQNNLADAIFSPV